MNRARRLARPVSVMPDAWYGPFPLRDAVPGTGLRREFETIRRTVSRWQG